MISNIYTLRTESGYSLRKLSKLCGVSWSYLNKLENNQVKQPSIRTCHKIANVLGVRIDDVFTFEGETSVIIDFEKYKKSKTSFTNKDASNAYTYYLNDSQRYMVTRMIISLVNKNPSSKEK